MAKARIILLGKLPPPYIGPAIATQVLLSSDLNQDFELHHFDTTLNEKVDQMGRFGWRKLMRSWRGYRNLYHLGRSTKADLALVPVSQTTMGFFKDSLYILALRRAGVPVLIQLRGSQFRNWFESSSPITRRWVRFVLAKTEGVIVLGEKLREVFAAFFPPERIYVSPNGADFPALQKRANPPSANKLRVLYLSNYLPGKGFDTVLQSMSLLKDEPVLLSAHGSWDDRAFEANCRKLIQGENLTYVALGESVSGEAKWNALKNASVFVFVPRHPEGHPWAIVEALAAGLPVISTDRGAITETVVDGENGFIVPVDDPQALAEKLRYFARNPDVLQRMGIASRKKYEDQFTQSKMATRYKNIFNKVLSQCAE